MGFYDDRLLPRLTDVLLGKPMEPIRARVTEGLAGEVLEIGFGSGRNLRHLPPGVTRLLAVEPASGGRDLAQERVARSPFPVDFIGVDAAGIDLPNESVDHALVTWSLCTIPDVEEALGEVRRVLRPGGTLHFAEHGRSPEPKVARWQDRITPVWGRVFGGCHLNRPIAELIAGAGLQIERLDTGAMRGPDVFSFGYEGVAAKVA